MLNSTELPMHMLTRLSADPFVWLVAYFMTCFALLGLLLIGDHPWVRGTPIAWCHTFLTETCSSLGRQSAERLCGAACAKVVCSESTPLVQVLYLILVLFGTFQYIAALHDNLPVPYVPAIHKVIAPLCPLIAIVSFWNVCFSDPGYVTPDTHVQHQQLFDYDNCLWTPRHCQVCNMQRPARARHCDVCNRCVARFDHHCIWINNCVGLNNMRHFLFFLCVNAAICGYGSVTCFLFLLGSMRKNGQLQRMVWDRRLDRPVALSRKPLLLAYTAFHEYREAAVLFLLLLACGLVVALFLTNHVVMALRNLTTYEVHKCRHLKATVRQLQLGDYLVTGSGSNMAELMPGASALAPDVPTGKHQHSHPPAHHTASQQQLMSPIGAGSADNRQVQLAESSLQRQHDGDLQQQHPDDMLQVHVHHGVTVSLWHNWRRVTYVGSKYSLPPNLYNKGWRRNLLEVLMPTVPRPQRERKQQ